MSSQKQHKRFAVIGAGASGLAALKSCLEDGHEAVCFERAENVGGLWNYTEDRETRRGNIMKCTIANISKVLYAFSDFPVPKDWPLYLRHEQQLQYFNMYAEHFDLIKHIRFNTDVVMVKKAADFAETGRWVVQIRQTKDDAGQDKEEELVFDGVLVATGYNCKKNIPEIPGQDAFQGTILHSKDYRDGSGFEGKNVVIIGCGNSAADVSTDVSRVAKQVYLSTRRGAWVFTRVGPSGLPFDYDFLTRYWNFLAGSVLPSSIACWITERGLNNHFDHQNFGLKPSHRAHAQIPVFADDLAPRIMSGSIRVKPGVQRILPKGVEFTDGSKVEDIDVIIHCTGYKIDFPFLEKGVVDMEGEGLYMRVFPPRLEQPTLAIIGCVYPAGPVMAVGEMQARWAVQVLSGVRSLPQLAAERLASIKAQREALAAVWPCCEGYSYIQGFYIPMMDELAERIGCKPNLTKLWLTDPWLAWKCYFGPCSGTQYRIHGPHPWKGARKTIMEMYESVILPLKARVKEQEG